MEILSIFSQDHHLSCPTCGAGLEDISSIGVKMHQQIEDLGSQVQILTARVIDAGKLPYLMLFDP